MVFVTQESPPPPPESAVPSSFFVNILLVANVTCVCERQRQPNKEGRKRGVARGAQLIVF